MAPRTPWTARLAMALALALACDAPHGAARVDGPVAPPPDTAAPPHAGSAITGTIYAFGGPSSPAQDGAEPKGTLTAMTAGTTTVLYGRTAIGGSDDCGTIFSIDLDGTDYQVLYRFTGSDGCDPRHDAMTLDPSDGKLYSTTLGVNQQSNATYGNFGQIVSFIPGAAIAPPIQALHVFADPTPTKSPFDGAEQHSSFSIDPSSGALYGQTAAGGANGNGMLYAVATNGAAFTDLHDFAKTDGDDPHGRIVLVDGTLYGIARQGGAAGLGTVYAYALGSGAFTVRHDFAGGPTDAAFSDHGYLMPVDVGGATVLFGVTQCGGSGSGDDACSKSNGGGDGAIFQIDPAGSGSASFNLVYAFAGSAAGDGAAPFGSLLYDGQYLYGTTSAGGAYDQGTVFRLLPPAFGEAATPTILYSFGGAANDGAKPIDNVIEVGSTLYGMTVYGGTTGPSPDGSGFTGNGAIFALPLP